MKTRIYAAPVVKGLINERLEKTNGAFRYLDKVI